MGISKYIYAEESSKNRIRRLMKTKILLAKGYGIDEIAVHLGVSANVVRGYIRECGHITLEEAEKYFHNSLLGG